MNVGEFYLLRGNCFSRVFLIQTIFNVKDSYHEDAIIYVKGFAQQFAAERTYYLV